MSLLVRVRDASTLVSLVCLLLLLFSGWALMAGYVPSDAEAFASTLYLRQQGGVGRTLQSLHHLLASVVVVSGFLLLLTSYLAGRPAARPASWWLGLTAFLLVLGVNFTGYLLPMDQNAYWGTVVRLGIVETIPAIGSVLASLLRGGSTINAASLPRFYTLHTAVLPLLLGLAVTLGVRAGLRRRPPRPGAAARWILAAILMAALAYACAATRPAPLELERDLVDSEYVPRPEWYFMWLFQLGKYVEPVPWVESLVVPAVGLGFLVLVPLLPVGSRRTRWAVGLGWCACWMVLTGAAYRADRDLPPRLDYEQAIRLRAEAWYVDMCYECHGDGGAGDGPESRTFDYETPDLTRAETWVETGPIEMIRSISSGKGDDMPGFGRRLRDRDIVALIDFLRETFLENGSRLEIPEESEEDA